MIHFDRPPLSLDEVFEFIQKSDLGRKILQEFHLKTKKIPIEIKPYPAEIRSRLLEELPPATPIGASFVTDGDEGTIYMDFQGDLGVLIPFLFHEIVHSLDESLWRAAKYPPKSREKRESSFRSRMPRLSCTKLISRTT